METNVGPFDPQHRSCIQFLNTTGGLKAWVLTSGTHRWMDGRTDGWQNLHPAWKCLVCHTAFNLPLDIMWWIVRRGLLRVTNHIHLGSWHLINKLLTCCHNLEPRGLILFPHTAFTDPPADITTGLTLIGKSPVPETWTRTCREHKQTTTVSLSYIHQIFKVFLWLKSVLRFCRSVKMSFMEI